MPKTKNKNKKNKSKKKSTKYIKSFKPKKRTYNEMIEENNKIIDPHNMNSDNKEESKSLIFNPFIKRINKDSNNLIEKETKTGKNGLFNIYYRFDKTYMPSEEIIKSNEFNRNLNYSIYNYFNNLFKKSNYDQILKNIKINEDCLLTQTIYGDGNCLFRAISDQVYGSEIHHTIIRQKCMDYIVVLKRFFSL